MKKVLKELYITSDGSTCNTLEEAQEVEVRRKLKNFCNAHSIIAKKCRMDDWGHERYAVDKLFEWQKDLLECFTTSAVEDCTDHVTRED